MAMVDPTIKMSTSNRANIVATAEYHRWRTMIFTISPEQGRMFEGSTGQVYGVIMDVGLVDRQRSTNWAISLTAFQTGEASFHPTPGGRVIGLGNDPKVAQTAKEIVAIAEGLLPATAAAQDFPLPEPGYVQFFFLTTSGVRVVKGHLHDWQQPGGSFSPLLQRFGLIRQFADRILAEKKAGQHSHSRNLSMKRVYILAFTPGKLDSQRLLTVTRLAGDMLEAKDPVFKRLMKEQVGPQTPIELANQEHIAIMHTPQTMQSTMKGWLETTYKAGFNPVVGSNFFAHGMRDPQGRVTYVMFYFEFEGG